MPYAAEEISTLTHIGVTEVSIFFLSILLLSYYLSFSFPFCLFLSFPTLSFSFIPFPYSFPFIYFRFVSFHFFFPFLNLNGYFISLSFYADDLSFLFHLYSFNSLLSFPIIVFPFFFFLFLNFTFHFPLFFYTYSFLFAYNLLLRSIFFASDTILSIFSLSCNYPVSLAFSLHSFSFILLRLPFISYFFSFLSMLHIF